MKIPFTIFPKIGYKNSQFQIVSSENNLKVDIYSKSEKLNSVIVNSDFPTVLSNLNIYGKLIAKCTYNNEQFEQEFEIKQAIRLGSSEFKKAFVFEETRYSFFLMKDRLLIYDEKKKILLTENHYSPTEIYKIDKSNYLFVTRIGNSKDGIVNICIYNLDTFSIDGELLNDYREIKILADHNKAWLFNKRSKTIHCFELSDRENTSFKEIIKYERIENYFLDNSGQNIFIDYKDNLLITNLYTLNIKYQIEKKLNNAVDKLGNIFNLDNDVLTLWHWSKGKKRKHKLSFKLNLQKDNFVYIGDNLKSEIATNNFDNKVQKIVDEIDISPPKSTPYKNYYNHSLSYEQRISELHTSHNIFVNLMGTYIVKKEYFREITSIIFKKKGNQWTKSARIIPSINYSLSFISDKNKLLLNKKSYLYVENYNESAMLLSYSDTSSHRGNNKLLCSGEDKLEIDKDCIAEIFRINEISYCLIKTKLNYNLYTTNDNINLVLNEIEILNPDHIKEHKIIWYSGKEKYFSSQYKLMAYDLKTSSLLVFDEKKVKHSLFKSSTDYELNNGYALSSNKVVFNPKNLIIKDAFIGDYVTHSYNLNKVVSHRKQKVYLSNFNNQSKKYDLSEIDLEDNKYEESYFSPNGDFLVLKEESNKYVWYDINKNETTDFTLGNFLAFRNDGSLIVEEDNTRNIKIYDPVTLKDITPPNYHHYRFLSPDGKLFAQTVLKRKYINLLTEEEITIDLFQKFKDDLDESNNWGLSEKEKKIEKEKLEKNRKLLFNKYKEKFEEKGINQYLNIKSEDVVLTYQYIEIGIVGTEQITEIKLPKDTSFYNYAAFSHDNQYIGIVGKPNFSSWNKSLILICSLSIDEINKSLIVKDRTVSRLPERAAWVCGFSKTGYFATYDSIPDTYLIEVNNHIFENKIDDIDVRQNTTKLDDRIYNSYQNQHIVNNKNFLCFSPSGDYLALSEQGYEPLTLGGYGHQESSAVHVAKTETGEILNSFNEHGSYIVDPNRKDTIFVSFSEDEKMLMSMSKDGVVIIRDLTLDDNIEDKDISTMQIDCTI